MTSWEQLGLWGGAHESLPSSAETFPDAAQYRIEIPSTEGPECLAAVLDEADKLGVTVHRVSQGTGVFLLTDHELDEMATLAAERGVEVSLFARPTADWWPSAMSRATAGKVAASTVRGVRGLRAALDDIARAADRGFRSVLISDLGLLAAFGRARAAALLPPDMQAKVSVMLPAANPMSARVLADLGASTINIPTDLELPDLAALRAEISTPLDVYIEAPDNLGGFVRHHEASEVIRVAAPVYIKLGLRNAPDIYPSGSHLTSTAIALSRERVRRARLVLDLLEREGCSFRTSPTGAPGLAIPHAPRVL